MRKSRPDLSVSVRSGLTLLRRHFIKGRDRPGAVAKVLSSNVCFLASSSRSGYTKTVAFYLPPDH
ncbi:hypothetical protein BLAT2472_30453 [Burkholderia latens]